MADMLARFFALAALCASSLPALDLKNAVIVAPAGLSGPEKKVAPMLVEEIEKRTRLRLTVTDRAPASGPAISIGGRPSIPAVPGADGYRIEVRNGSVLLA